MLETRIHHLTIGDLSKRTCQQSRVALVHDRNDESRTNSYHKHETETKGASEENTVHYSCTARTNHK